MRGGRSRMSGPEPRDVRACAARAPGRSTARPRTRRRRGRATAFRRALHASGRTVQRPDMRRCERRTTPPSNLEERGSCRSPPPTRARGRRCALRLARLRARGCGESASMRWPTSTWRRRAARWSASPSGTVATVARTGRLGNRSMDFAYPIVLAPLAGGPSTPGARRGGLECRTVSGSSPAATSTPDELREPGAPDARADRPAVRRQPLRARGAPGRRRRGRRLRPRARALSDVPRSASRASTTTGSRTKVGLLVAERVRGRLDDVRLPATRRRSSALRQRASEVWVDGDLAGRSCRGA